jgi:hypothetical protein
MNISTVSAAIGLLTSVSKAIDAVRERAKTSKDSELKESISNLYDEFLSLKAIIGRLTEENNQLRQSIASNAVAPKPAIRQVGQTNYYFVGDEGPYCQKCYDTTGKLVALQPRQRFMGGLGRKCVVCGTVFFEEVTPPRRMPRGL